MEREIPPAFVAAQRRSARETVSGPVETVVKLWEMMMWTAARQPKHAPVPQEVLEALIRADYERCRPSDRFDDLKRRARFTKEDKGLLRDWMALAEIRYREKNRPTTPALAA